MAVEDDAPAFAFPVFGRMPLDGAVAHNGIVQDRAYPLSKPDASPAVLINQVIPDRAGGVPHVYAATAHSALMPVDLVLCNGQDRSAVAPCKDRHMTCVDAASAIVPDAVLGVLPVRSRKGTVPCDS